MKKWDPPPLSWAILSDFGGGSPCCYLRGLGVSRGVPFFQSRKKIETEISWILEVGSTAQHCANLCIKLSAFQPPPLSATPTLPPNRPNRMSFSKSIKAMSIDDLEILKKSLEAQLRDVRAAIKKHASDDEDSGSETESSSKKPKTAKKPATPRKPTAWAAWTKAVKEKYAKEYAKESEKFKKAHDGKLTGGKGVGGFAIIFAKMMREKHDDDYAEFEAEVKSANASEASSDEKPAKKAATKKPKTKKAKAPKASAAAAAETEDEAEEEREEAAEEEAAAPTEIQASECIWKVLSINGGTKYAYETKTRGCWNRNEDKTRADWAGLYDPETKKLDTSAPEIVITE